MTERLDLEFKDALPEDTVDLSRWLAAMANAGGGSIVFGIEEDAQGRAIRPSELAIQLDPSIVRVGVAAGVVDEPVRVRTVPIKDEGAAPGFGSLVVEIDASPRVPHFVDGTAWIRVEHGIRPMQRAEIARLFARSERFVQESGLAAAIRRPAEIVADIQRLGNDRVLMFKNVGGRPAFGVRWHPLDCRGVVARSGDDPFPVEVMPPLATHAVRTLIAPSELPAKIEVSWRDDRDAPRRMHVVVT
jgi:hypothetical protein